MPEYIVTTDQNSYITRLQPAKLYRRSHGTRYVLAASGTSEQMQALADKLNGVPDAHE